MNRSPYNRPRRWNKRITLTKRKTCLTIGFTLLTIACVAGIVVGIIVATAGGETHKLPEPTPIPKNSNLITMAFNLGYRPTTQQRYERSNEQKNAQVDNTQQLLELVIDQIADDLNSENLAIQLVPYAEEVLFDLIPNQTFTADETLSAINKLFQRRVPLKNDPNQYAASVYCQNTLVIKRIDGNFAAKSNQSKLMFITPDQRLYSSLDAFKLDAKQTGPVLNMITTNTVDVLLVGLNQTDEMRSTYGLNSSSVQVVPDGMNQIPDIVDGLIPPTNSTTEITLAPLNTTISLPTIAVITTQSSTSTPIQTTTSLKTTSAVPTTIISTSTTTPTSTSTSTVITTTPITSTSIISTSTKTPTTSTKTTPSTSTPTVTSSTTTPITSTSKTSSTTTEEPTTELNTETSEFTTSIPDEWDAVDGASEFGLIPTE